MLKPIAHDIVLDLSFAEKEMPTEEGLIPIQTGELILDAACTQTDLVYPFDVRILHQNRL